MLEGPALRQEGRAFVVQKRHPLARCASCDRIPRLMLCSRAIRPRAGWSCARLGPLFYIVAFALLLPLASPVSARAQLAKVEAGDLRLVYIDPSETYLVPYAARAFLNAMKFHRSLFDYEPREKVTVLLADFSDYGNASATSVPRDSLQIQIAPMSYVFETVPPSERMAMVMSHELVHVVTMDQATGRDVVFRRVFGGKVNPHSDQPESVLYFYLTTPRVASPRWYLEGMAVFADTWMMGGIGRAQGGYDEMVFRAMVRDNARFYDPLGLVAEGTKIDFQVEANSYLYGTRFMTWLAYHYSPDHLVRWVSRKPGSRAYYASQFREVFQTSIEDAWQEWIAWERKFQSENLASIRRYPVTEATDLSSRALGSVSRAYYDPDTRQIFAGINYPGVVAHVGAISAVDGSVERIVDIKGPKLYQVTSLAWDASGRQLFYTTDNGDFRNLMRLDPATGTTEQLQKDLRVGDLAFNAADRSLWGIRHLNGIASIVRIPEPYTDWTRLVSFPYGTAVYDLDVSPDGTMVSVGYGEISGAQSLRVVPAAALERGDTTPVASFDFGVAVPTGFVFSPDGRFLYGSSYYTGASNIFRFEIATSDLEAVTNAETGFMRPVPIGGDELIVFRYTGEGFVPARMTATVIDDVSPVTFLGERLIDKHPVLKTWQLGSPSAIDWEAEPKTTGTYGLAGGLRVESIYPIVQGYKDSAAVGVRADLSDPIRINRASVSLSYSPNGELPTAERVHLSADYQRFDWTATAAWNESDFYDLFGPTKTSRKGYSASLSHLSLLLNDLPRRLDLEVAGRVAGNLDQLPDYQNIPVDVDTLLSFDVDLSFSSIRSSLGHVDDEKGLTWGLRFSSDYVNSAYFGRLMGTFDMGRPLPAGHSSIWLRTAAGFSPQDPKEPFANFFFGGFGNNYVDHVDEKRYRRYYSFPGAELNEIGGRNFARALVEWNLPPVRFSGAGTPGAYLTWARPALFVGGLATNMDDGATRREALTAGGQIDFRFTFLSALDLTLSAGGAARFERGERTTGELMVSLRVLR